MFFSRISFKLALIIAISLVGMIVMGPIALYTMRAQMMTDRQAKTQQMVDIGYGILAHYQKLESDGKLSKADAQAAELVKLRYFAGLSIPQAATALGTSPRSADFLWAYARAWLLRSLGDADAKP